MDRKIRALHWAIALLGLWEAGDIVAPFVPGFGAVPAFVWSHILAGIILIVSGGYAAIRREAGTARTMDWIALVAGAWLITASFVLSNPVISPGLWNDVAVGILVVMLALATMLLQRRA